MQCCESGFVEKGVCFGGHTADQHGGKALGHAAPTAGWVMVALRPGSSRHQALGEMLEGVAIEFCRRTRDGLLGGPRRDAK